MKTKLKILSVNLKIILAVVSILSVLSFPYHIKAHSNNKWLLVNGQNIVNENPTPYSLALPSAEHIVDKQFSANENINVYADLTMLGINNADATVAWKLPNSQTLLGTNQILNFPQTGTYIIHLIATLKNTLTILDQEDIIFNIGQPISPAKILINDALPIIDPATATVNIDRTKTYTFSIKDSDIQNYTYQWELGDADLHSDLRLNKSFPNTNFPSYIFLRTTNKSTNVYADSYLKLDSSMDKGFKVQMPPDIAALNNSPINNTSYTVMIPRTYLIQNNYIANIIFGLVIIAALIFGLVILIRFFYLKGLKSRKQTE